MNKSIAVTVAMSCCFALSAAAQEPVSPGLSTGFQSIQESTLRADLTFLASDALEGRMSLQAGRRSRHPMDRRRIRQSRTPARRDRKPETYLQPVNLIEYRGDRARSYVAVTRNGAETTIPGLSPDAYGAFPDDVDLAGDVVFAGFGITAPELHYDDYANIDAAAKSS